MRVLADMSPPYGVRELATKATLTPGYVSRLLEALDREALVERDQRGRVTAVDLARLLRRYAESYDTLRSNERSLFIARTGATQAAARLGELTGRTAITGSFAAQRLNPIAAPSLLAVYCTEVTATARALDLLPADEGANVALLRPFDPVVWDRTVNEGGLTYVSPTQVALDCLAGNGRMPAEGEAVLTWLVAARRILLDALKALAPHGDAFIVAGAQAIYLHAGAAVLDESVAPFTTDGDLAVNPSQPTTPRHLATRFSTSITQPQESTQGQ